MMRHSTRAGLALRALNETDPAMAALSLWCDHRDVEAGPAAATSGSTIRYGPGFDLLPRHEQIGLAAHHILHVALRHTARMAAMEGRLGDRFDAEVYNIAADAIVNEALLQAGHALPRPALRLTDLLAETLQDRTPVREALAQWDVDRLYTRLMQGTGGGKNGAEGAKAHAAEQAFAQDMTPQQAAAGPDQATGPEPDAADWRRHLARAMEAGRAAGHGVGVLGHRLADIAVPETPWEIVLRGIVTRAVSSLPQLTHRRPARPWIAMEAEALRCGGPVPAFQPGTRRNTPQPHIVVAMDTSSSIDDDRLALFMGEVAGIARRSAAQIDLLPFDETAHPALRLDPARWQAQVAALTFPRGGGTSFGPVIAAAMTLAPSVIVVLTDLDGEFGPRPRGVPVIWAVPDDVAPPAPPFGTVLSLAR